MSAKNINDIKEKGLKQLAKIKAKVVYDETLPSEKSVLSHFFTRTPWMARFLPAAKENAGAISGLGEQISGLDTSNNGRGIASRFHYANVGLATLDFLRIPLVYIAALLLKIKIPALLKDRAAKFRWVYSGVLVGLAVTVLTLPVAAPFIGFAVAILTFGEAVYLLAKTVNDYRRLKKESKALPILIDQALRDMERIQTQARELGEELKEEQDGEKIKKLEDEINKLEMRFEGKKLEIEGLKKQKILVDKALSAIDLPSLINRPLAFGLATLALAGVILSLFFPPLAPVGLLIATVAGTAGLFQGSLNFLRSAYKLMKQLGLDNLMNKAAGSILSAAVVAGLVATLIAPPLGFLILTFAAICAAVLVIGNLVVHGGRLTKGASEEVLPVQNEEPSAEGPTQEANTAVADSQYNDSSHMMLSNFKTEEGDNEMDSYPVALEDEAEVIIPLLAPEPAPKHEGPEPHVAQFSRSDSFLTFVDNVVSTPVRDINVEQDSQDSSISSGPRR